jgi:hypothetical protein
LRIFADYEYLVYYITVFAENKIFWKNISIPHGRPHKTAYIVTNTSKGGSKMSSMNENLLDKIARADFSMETDFKSVLRKRLFESGANKKSGILQFQRLSDMELDMVSAAGDMDFLRQQEQKNKKDKNQ